MEQNKDATAILLEFELLTDEEIAKVRDLLRDNGEFLGSSSMNFDSSWGGVTIYQP